MSPWPGWTVAMKKASTVVAMALGHCCHHREALRKSCSQSHWGPLVGIDPDVTEQKEFIHWALAAKHWTLGNIGYFILSGFVSLPIGIPFCFFPLSSLANGQNLALTPDISLPSNTVLPEANAQKPELPHGM